MIISNSTPLLAFARIDELGLLEQTVQHVIIPEAVWHEVTYELARPGVGAIRRATWEVLLRDHTPHSNQCANDLWGVSATPS
jgi:predicted nucleic acid-binding protein